jgi:hypothetical protein
MIKIIDIPNELQEKEILLLNYNDFLTNSLKVFLRPQLNSIFNNDIFKVMVKDENVDKLLSFFDLTKKEKYNDNYIQIKESYTKFFIETVINNPEIFLYNNYKSQLSKISLSIYEIKEAFKLETTDSQVMVEIKEDLIIPVKLLDYTSAGFEFGHYILRDLTKPNASNIDPILIEDESLKVFLNEYNSSSITYNEFSFFSGCLATIKSNPDLTYKNDINDILKLKEVKKIKSVNDILKIFKIYIKKTVVKSNINLKNIINLDNKIENILKEIKLVNNNNYSSIQKEKLTVKSLKEKLSIYAYIVNNDKYINLDSISSYVFAKYYMYDAKFNKKDLTFFIETYKSLILEGINELRELDNTYIKNFIKEDKYFPKTIKELIHFNTKFKKSIEGIKINRMLNSTKGYAYLSKDLIREHIELFNVKNISVEEKYEDLYIKVFNEFKILGISEKKYRVFLKSIINMNNIVIKKSGIEHIDTRVVHDIFYTLIPRVFDLVFQLKSKDKSDSLKKVKLLKYIGIITSYNGDSNKILNITQLFIELISHPILEKDISVIKNENDISKIIWRYKKEIYEKRKKGLEVALYNIDIDSSLETAMLMKREDNFLNIMEHIIKEPKLLKEFNEEPLPLLNKKSEFYSLSIEYHNTINSVLSTGVSGVCISMDSEFKKEQLSSNYLNLIVTNKENMPILWGLLVELKDKEGGRSYIMNNFQGSINDKKIDSHEIKNAVITMLKQLIQKEEIDNIYIPKLFFNTIDLSENLSKVKDTTKDLYLLKDARLDFSFNKDTLKINLEETNYGSQIFELNS